MNRTWFLAGLAVGVWSGAASGDVINVGPGGSIQAAIDAAQDGDEIVVAPATYIENFDIGAKDLILRSSDGAEVTILRPESPDDPILHIILSDVVVDGFNGLLVPRRDPDALARAILRLAEDEELRQRFGAASRQRATQRFDLVSIAGQISSIYSDLLRQKGLSPASS